VRAGFDEPPPHSLSTAATQLQVLEPEQASEPIASERIVSARTGLDINTDEELSALHNVQDEDPRSSFVRRREDRAQKKTSRVAGAILMIGVMLAAAVVWGRTQHTAWFEKLNTIAFGATPALAPSLPASLPEPATEPVVDQPASAAIVETAPIAPVVEAPPVVPPPVAQPPEAVPENAEPVKTQAPKSGLQPREPSYPRVERKEKDKAPAVLAAQPQPASLDAPVIATDVKDKFGCPHGMVFVPGGRFSMGSSPSDEYHNFSDKLLSAVDVRPFCVDRYEFPNTAGSVPMVNVSFKQAKQLCENAGKRLCAEDEWERACKGPAGTRFPYGNEFEEGTCNVGRDDGARGLRSSGASAQCRSGFGVVDMSGNVAEWTSSPMAGGDFILKGGDAAHPDYASRCANRAALSGAKKTPQVGFRCCAMPE
jgi:hypothetical protein